MEPTTSNPNEMSLADLKDLATSGKNQQYLEVIKGLSKATNRDRLLVHQLDLHVENINADRTSAAREVVSNLFIERLEHEIAKAGWRFKWFSIILSLVVGAATIVNCLVSLGVIHR